MIRLIWLLFLVFFCRLRVLQQEWYDRVMPESIEVATLLDPRFEEIMEMFSERPHTFAHADTRLDNIFFSKMVLMKLLLLTFNYVFVEKG